MKKAICILLVLATTVFPAAAATVFVEAEKKNQEDMLVRMDGDVLKKLRRR